MGTKKKEQPKLVNHFGVVVDESGSMVTVSEAARRCINTTFETIAHNAAQSGQHTTVSLARVGHKRFSPNDAEVTHIGRTPGEMLGQGADYNPCGNTPLWDGIKKTIDALYYVGATTPGASYVVMVITDGEDNCSRSATYISIRDEIRRLQSTGQWSFVFQVPPRSRDRLVQLLGLEPGNVQEWERTNEGLATATVSNVKGIGEFYATRSAGGQSVNSFYQTTADSISTRDAKAALDNIAKSITLLEVPVTGLAAMEIRAFVIANGKPWVRGKAYYQLTKKETIQAGKSLILVDKTDRTKAYGGSDARRLLGLPEQTVPVTPGAHGTWDIFVQSTSNNRKLVGGTLVIYRD